MKPTIPLSFCCALLVSVAFQAGAFSLRGPEGNAVNLGEEYRWNVPIVTYDFDQSFLDYFGEKGVKAVDDAFAILNALPRASRIDLENYPLDSRRVNVVAAEQGLLDLKSVALARVVGQLGLASPTEHIFDRVWSNPPPLYGTNIQPYTVYHNFDPQTLLPSQTVNGVLYQQLGFSVETPVDPLAMAYNAVADQRLQPGQLYSGLTRDDVGGLRYLLSRTNLNREPLPWARNPARTMIWRGGVEKITFVRQRQPHRSGMLWLTSRLPNSRLARQPDLTFGVIDAAFGLYGGSIVWPSAWISWNNCAAWNGNPDGAGPGVIHGPTRIMFGKLGPVVRTGETNSSVSLRGWGSFVAGTNPPVCYPYQTNRNREALVRLLPAYYLSQPLIHVPVPLGGTVALQTSTNGTDWVTACIVVNTGGIIEWYYYGSSATFFRAVSADGAPPTPPGGLIIERPILVLPPVILPPMTPLPPGLTPEEQLILIEAERRWNGDPGGVVVLPPTPLTEEGEPPR